jgi:pimeloyl-ACP methyl ester carboxylesterase
MTCPRRAGIGAPWIARERRGTLEERHPDWEGRMRIHLHAALLALAVTSAMAQTVEHVNIKGANALITVPQGWNGSVFLYAHGYTSDRRILAPIPDDIAKATLVLWPGLLPFVPPGYATAVTTFRSIGWDVKDAVKDVENLRRYFVKKYGTPKHTYLWGHSEGGMITEAVIEYFPKIYDGAAPMCGTGGGARRLFNAEYDLRVLFEYACRDVPDARFVCGLCTDGTSRCIEDADCPAGQTCGATEAPPAPEDGLTRECTDFVLDHPERFDGGLGGGTFVTRAITPCFGNTTRSPAQASRRDFLVRASQLPENQLDGDLFFASIGLAEVVHRRTHGQHPWGNLGVIYASPMLTADEQTALNAGVHRSDSDAAAVRYMRRFYEPRGRTGSKVVTVHALDDGLVIPEHEDKYRQAFEAAGRADQLVQFFTPTGQHCANAEAFEPALDLLTAWVEQKEKPTTASMNAACFDCLAATGPGPFGMKVVERRQKGAPIRSLVCSGETGDCPTGTVCSVQKHRCE